MVFRRVDVKGLRVTNDWWIISEPIYQTIILLACFKVVPLFSVISSMAGHDCPRNAIHKQTHTYHSSSDTNLANHHHIDTVIGFILDTQSWAPEAVKR
jgi:hypothetical protein